MKLKRLEIHNYKSLRNVVLEPGPLSVFVGPNAAGKSNFADALDFLGEVYRWDLEGAVKKKGGYENICFRQAKRGDDRIRFRVVLEIERKFRKRDASIAVPGTGLILDHTFELGIRSRGPRGAFYVLSESFSAYGIGESANELVVRLLRSEEKSEAELPPHSRKDLKSEHDLDPESLAAVVDSLGSSEGLSLETMRLFFPWVTTFTKTVSALRVFQLNPRHCRGDGVPTPNADLDRFGGNLPAVIDYLKREEPQEYSRLLDAVRRVLPSLESVETDFTHTKTLGLFLKEIGVNRSWTAEDLSDGTIQAIALLAATFDPRIPIIVIEEPENSVHPWAIRTFVQAFREASEQKQIFLTTHSPILIDQIRPEELWVVQRPRLETKISPVLELDPSLKEAWGQGKFTLSEYLDSGALPEAVPAPGS